MLDPQIQTLIENIFNEFVWQPLIKREVAKLALSFSFGPTSWIASVAINLADYLGQKLYDALKGVVNFEFIILRDDAHQKAYTSACMSLKNIALQQGIDSDEFRKQKEIFKTQLATFVAFDPSGLLQA